MFIIFFFLDNQHAFSSIFPVPGPLFATRLVLGIALYSLDLAYPISNSSLAFLSCTRLLSLAVEPRIDSVPNLKGPSPQLGLLKPKIGR